MRTAKKILSVCFVPLAATVLAGCGKSLDPQKYGQIQYELPRVKGAETPYPLPELERQPTGETPDAK